MNIKIQERIVLGKKVKRLRKNGLMPAEIYGHNTINLHIQVSQKDFQKIYQEAGENTIVNLLTEQNDSIPALISHVSRDPITRKTLTADFLKVRMDQKIKTHVPIKFIGESPGEKAGLVLVKVTHELEVEALPTHLPHTLTVHLSALINAGDTIHVKDVAPPVNALILSNPETVIASLSEKTEEEPMPISKEKETEQASVQTKAKTDDHKKVEKAVETSGGARKS